MPIPLKEENMSLVQTLINSRSGHNFTYTRYGILFSSCEYFKVKTSNLLKANNVEKFHEFLAFVKSLVSCLLLVRDFCLLFSPPRLSVKFNLDQLGGWQLSS